MNRHLVVVLGTACILSCQFVLAGPGSVCVPGSGTYDVLVCKGPCSFAGPTNVVVKGTLVLTDEPFAIAAINDFSPARFEYAYTIGGDPNGCFVLDTIKSDQTYAGLITYGLTFWFGKSDQVNFDLYASPDAWHVASVTLSPTGFEGKGQSGGVGAAEPHLGSDVVVGRRLGPANLGKCIAAAGERRRKFNGAA